MPEMKTGRVTANCGIYAVEGLTPENIKAHITSAKAAGYSMVIASTGWSKYGGPNHNKERDALLFAHGFRPVVRTHNERYTNDEQAFHPITLWALCMNSSFVQAQRTDPSRVIVVGARVLRRTRRNTRRFNRYYDSGCSYSQERPRWAKLYA